jgi:hypothetical protein
MYTEIADKPNLAAICGCLDFISVLRRMRCVLFKVRMPSHDLKIEPPGGIVSVIYRQQSPFFRLSETIRVHPNSVWFLP